jgi:hypothetical protein
MLKTIPYLLTLFSVFCLQGQDSLVIKKYWIEGDLVQVDFKAKVKESSNLSSEIHFYFGYAYQTDKMDGVNYSRYVAFTYIDCALSWIKPEARNGTILRYNQTIFNISELYSRKLERKLNALEARNEARPEEISQYFQTFKSERDEVIATFKLEAERGLNDSAVFVWQEKILMELSETPRLGIPNYKLKNSSWSIDFGLGYGVLSGAMRDYLNNPLNWLQYGLMIEHRKVYYEMRATVGTLNTRKDLDMGNFSLAKGELNSLALFGFSAGYRLYKNDRMTLYPFAGFGIMQLSSTTSENERIDGPTRYQPNAGLNLDYRLKSIDLNHTVRMDSFLKFRSTYEWINYDGALQGGMLNFNVGFGITFQQIKVI